ncbi:MAG TPA: 4Fe-4S binding protein [Candidatus Brocadiia bacterium]|nr:4Fe-4S binding protein [Candidatus Brocadiia bacterium]
MAIRDIIHIDESKCNGCGQCVTACVEGALKLVNGKAKLTSETYCDGLGACLGHCPTGALTIEKREAPGFDEAAAMAQAGHPAAQAHACPGQAARLFARKTGAPGHGAQAVPRRDRNASPERASASALTHWPVQLKLISPASPAYRCADVLIAADCVACALGDFHQRLLPGHSLIIACPKLDDWTGYVEKLTDLFRRAQPRSVTVARMEVPCCGGLVKMVLEARRRAASDLPVKVLTVGVEGGVVDAEIHAPGDSPAACAGAGCPGA